MCIKQLLWAACWFTKLFPGFIFSSQRKLLFTSADSLMRWAGSLSCVFNHVANLPTSLPQQTLQASLLRSENTAPATLLLEFCAFLIGGLCGVFCYLNTAFFQRRPQGFLTLSHPLHSYPWSQRVRNSTSCLHYAVGNSEPHKGEIALQSLKVNIPGIPCDLATFLLVQ